MRKDGGRVLIIMILFMVFYVSETYAQDDSRLERAKHLLNQMNGIETKTTTKTTTQNHGKSEEINNNQKISLNANDVLQNDANWWNKWIVLVMTGLIGCMC